MKNITSHAGTLYIIGRLPQSKNGNPRYELSIDGFHCITAVDSDSGYTVPNYDGKTVIATIGTHYGKPTLNTITKGA